MNETKTPGYRRFALAAVVAMALGPLTALSLASLDRGYTRSAAASSGTATVLVYDSTRYAGAEYDGKQLADVVAGSGSLDLFNNVLAAADLAELLQGQDQYTVFIPVNEAFSTLSESQLAATLNDSDKVQRLAKAHVVPGRVTATDLMAATQLRSINGDEIVARVGADLTVNGASIIGTEVAGNGIVHFIDRVL